MKKAILAMTLGGIALLTIDSLVSKYKAHRNYQKGWNDGVEFGCALSNLEHTLEEILENHK